MDTWNPVQYEKFRREREQPFFDLLALIQPAPGIRAVDLGCGTGKLTEELHTTLHARSTVGIDRSAKMLEGARSRALPPGLTFEVGTIESFAAPGEKAEYDLIVSNAAFHWIEHHDALIARLAAALTRGGQLAFQVPAMHGSPTHTIAEELAASTQFGDAFGGWRRPQPVLTPDQYSRLLYRAGFVEQHVRLVIYPHVLADRDAAVEWMKGTLLTEYERHLPPGAFGPFLAAYRERLTSRLEDTRPFFFPFQRILCWGRRAA